MKKKKIYSVYKNINKESEHYGTMFYSLTFTGETVGSVHGSNECVFIGDDLNVVMNLVNNSIREE